MKKNSEKLYKINKAKSRIKILDFVIIICAVITILLIFMIIIIKGWQTSTLWFIKAKN